MGKVNMKINLYKITQTLQYLKRKKKYINVTKTLTLKKSDLSIEQFGFQQDLQSITKKKNWIITWEVHPKIDYNCGKENKMSKRYLWNRHLTKWHNKEYGYSQH